MAKASINKRMLVRLSRTSARHRDKPRWTSRIALFN